MWSHVIMLGFPLELFWVNCLPAKALCLVWKHATTQSSHHLLLQQMHSPTFVSRSGAVAETFSWIVCACEPAHPTSFPLFFFPTQTTSEVQTHVYMPILICLRTYLLLYILQLHVFWAHFSYLSRLTDLIKLKWPGAKSIIASEWCFFSVFLLSDGVCLTPHFFAVIQLSGVAVFVQGHIPGLFISLHQPQHALPHTYDTLSVASWVRAGTVTTLLWSATTNMVKTVNRLGSTTVKGSD